MFAVSLPNRFRAKIAPTASTTASTAPRPKTAVSTGLLSRPLTAREAWRRIDLYGDLLGGGDEVVASWTGPDSFCAET